MLQQVGYKVRQEVLRGQQSFTNVVSDICDLSTDLNVQDDKHSESGKKPMIKQERRRTNWQKT